MIDSAISERERIVAHIREGAARLLATAMMEPQRFDMRTAEQAATVMEETAAAIEGGDHWRAFE